MVSTLGASAQALRPGEFDDVSTSDDYLIDRASGSYSGSGTYREGIITPTFQPGEIWLIKARLTLSTEPSDDIVVFELMDEGENYYIQKATIPEFGGNDAEINCIVTYAAASNNGSSSSPSPDLRVTVVGADSANYFIDTNCIRLKKANDTAARTYRNTSTETVDS